MHAPPSSHMECSSRCPEASRVASFCPAAPSWWPPEMPSQTGTALSPGTRTSSCCKTMWGGTGHGASSTKVPLWTKWYLWKLWYGVIWHHDCYDDEDINGQVPQKSYWGNAGDWQWNSHGNIFKSLVIRFSQNQNYVETSWNVWGKAVHGKIKPPEISSRSSSLHWHGAGHHVLLLEPHRMSQGWSWWPFEVTSSG